MSEMSGTIAKQRQFPCKSCGAMLNFEPGQQSLRCTYCHSDNAIASVTEPIQELDFLSALADRAAADQTHEILIIACNGCGAQTTLKTGTTAGNCPFCGAAIVAMASSQRTLKPKSLLPFHVTRELATSLFQNWATSRWFAPSDLREHARAESIHGVYLPYWTYDTDTTTRYTGQRGDDYTETQRYTAIVNGKTVTRTRSVTRTRWRSASGQVRNRFDDLLILASNSLPRKYVEKLEPWDLRALVPYQDDYLAGFVAESYQVDLTNGFELAKNSMAPVIRQTICSDIGGDRQRIDWTQTDYREITFKHLLLPVWISAYEYRGRTYRFLINARSGEVQGERPYSAAKIMLFVLLLVAILATVLLIAANS